MLQIAGAGRLCEVISLVYMHKVVGRNTRTIVDVHILDFRFHRFEEN